MDKEQVIEKMKNTIDLLEEIMWEETAKTVFKCICCGQALHQADCFLHWLIVDLKKYEKEN
jgi:hypothetical protein